MRSKRRVLWLGHRASGLASLLVLAGTLGCAGVAELPVARRGELPAVTAARELPPYRIQVGDVLDIKFALNGELNEQITVRPDGRISTTYVHDLPVYNRTVEEVQGALIAGYKSELKEPRLAVILRSFAPTRVYVAGEVPNPGEFVTVGPPLTVMQAIARAGGLKPSAMPERIIVMRRGAGEQAELYAVDLRAATERGEANADVRLAPYDVVWVPKTGVAEVYTAFNQYVQQFLPLSWSFVYQVHGSGAIVK
jgi:polysaccharide biosynthesis/export protein